MQTRWKTTIALLALALPLAGVASACDEDSVGDGEEDTDGINDVPPPSGGTESGNGNAAAIGPSAVSVGATIAAVGTGGGNGDGGAGQGGDGGAGGTSGTGGAGGSGGGSTGSAGTIGECALFPMNFVVIGACTDEASGSLASPAYQDEFNGDTSTLAQFGCNESDVVEEAVLALVPPLNVLEVGNRDPLVGPVCNDPIAHTMDGSLRGCDSQVTLPDDPAFAEATFGLRDLGLNGELANYGTISVTATQVGDNVNVEVRRFGPDADGENPMTTTLGLRTGEQLPLRLFLAHDAPNAQTCGGIVRGGEYICIGCWYDDEWTNYALDEGSLILSSSPTSVARFDNLNTPEATP